MTSLALVVAGPLLLTARSARGLGVSVAPPLLLPGGGSGVALETTAVFARLPAKPDETWMTSVNTWAGAPATRVGLVAVMGPLAPTAVASVRVQPAGKASETNVVPTGRASL